MCLRVFLLCFFTDALFQDVGSHDAVDNLEGNTDDEQMAETVAFLEGKGESDDEAEAPVESPISKPSDQEEAVGEDVWRQLTRPRKQLPLKCHVFYWQWTVGFLLVSLRLSTQDM